MNKNNVKPIEPVLALGLALEGIYLLVNRFIFQVPEILGMPWMLLSCILMIIGLYRTGKNIGTLLKK